MSNVTQPYRTPEPPAPIPPTKPSGFDARHVLGYALGVLACVCPYFPVWFPSLVPYASAFSVAQPLLVAACAGLLHYLPSFVSKNAGTVVAASFVGATVFFFAWFLGLSMQACSAAQWKAADAEAIDVTKMVCNPGLEAIEYVDFACTIVETAEGVTSLLVHVPVPKPKAKAFAAKYVNLDAGLSGVLVFTPDASVVLSDAPLVLPSTWTHGDVVFLPGNASGATAGQGGPLLLEAGAPLPSPGFILLGGPASINIDNLIVDAGAQ